jgi:hypothetical protein
MVWANRASDNTRRTFTVVAAMAITLKAVGGPNLNAREPAGDILPID